MSPASSQPPNRRPLHPPAGTLQRRGAPARAQRRPWPASSPTSTTPAAPDLRRARRARAPLRGRPARARPAREDRVLMVMHDSVDFPVAFLGALYAGIVPVPVNTLLTADDYAYMLEHSRGAGAARVAGRSGRRCARPSRRPPGRSGRGRRLRARAPAGTLRVRAPARGGAARRAGRHAAPTTSASGSIPPARPAARKGTVHTHANLYWTAALYGTPVLGLRESDVVLLGRQALLRLRPGQRADVPARVGATTVLMAERPTPAAVFKRWTEHGVTVFFGAPTGYAGMLASPELPARAQVKLRLCSSAGEALPREIGERFTAHFGCEIIDGIGSTEMLHIFLSNRPGDVNYGSTGRPVPGYEAAPRRRIRRRRRARRDRRPVRQRPELGADVLGPARQVARHVPGRMDQDRRQVFDRRRRLLHLRRPQRRHAQGQRHLRLAVRGRGHADAAPGGARMRP